MNLGVAGHPGGELDVDHPLVQSLVPAGNYLGILASPSRAGAMVCDAKILHGGGFAPAVVFGATGGAPHAVGEYVEVESVIATAQTLALASLSIENGTCEHLQAGTSPEMTGHHSRPV